MSCSAALASMAFFRRTLGGMKCTGRHRSGRSGAITPASTSTVAPPTKTGGNIFSSGARPASTPSPTTRGRDRWAKTTHPKWMRPIRNSAGPPRMTTTQVHGVCPVGCPMISLLPTAATTIPVTMTRWSQSSRRAGRARAEPGANAVVIRSPARYE